MPEAKNSKILKGRKELAAAIGVSENTIDKLIYILKLPVFQINGTWYGHIDKIEEHFASLCTQYRGKKFEVSDKDTEIPFESP